MEAAASQSVDAYAARHGYPTKPVETNGIPPGIPYIIGNEAAERFSFYGMRAILVIFMSQYLLNSQGKLDPMKPEETKYWYHLFVAGVYYLPLLGAILADGFLGKYRTILYLSVIYCLGNFALALDSTRIGLFTGLALIVIGAGGIKPCVSATVGDQFGKANQNLLSRVYGWFYFAINVGSVVSTVAIPFVLDKYGPHVAFAIPGVLMLLATLIFWSGRAKFVHMPPAGRTFIKDTFNYANLKLLSRLILLFAFVAVFWSLYDQTSSAWVLQAEHMDRTIFGYECKAAQVQAINPLLILVFIPLFSYVIYPIAGKFGEVTPLRKIGVGLFLTVIAFAISAYVEQHIAERPTVWWQLLGFGFMTAAEILISITCLEYSYTQAPPRLKSLVMSIYLCSIGTGDFFTAIVNKVIQNADGTSKLTGPQYYWFFTELMLVTAIVFVFASPLMKSRQTVEKKIVTTV